MTLLSTLRPLALRLWDNFWYFFSIYLLPVPAPSPHSLLSLNDDCLFLILAHFTVPELFQLRATSRSLSHRIEQYRLPRIQTLLTSNSVVTKKTGSQVADPINEGSVVKVAFTSSPHSYTDFCQRKTISGQQPNFFTSQPKNANIFSLKLSAFPLSLPQLLPRLSSLTFTHFLADQEEDKQEDSKKQEKATVNQIINSYLRSSWSGTLTSLHLYLVVPSKPTTQSNNDFFDRINELSFLKHLFLEFTQFIPQETLPVPLLPDAMPILGQVISFSLYNYGSPNTATLLSQLGPNLVNLSLHNVACSIEDYVAFLQAKSPTYGQTLKSLEVYLHQITDLRLFTAPVQYLSSLERLISPCLPRAEIVLFFTQLSRLSHLGEVSFISFFTVQLRALHWLHPRPGTLPQAPSITRATFHIFNNPILDGTEPFQIDELLNDYLPLLAHIFCSVKYLSITFFHLPNSWTKSKKLSKRLGNRTKELFPQLDHCIARVYN